DELVMDPPPGCVVPSVGRREDRTPVRSRSLRCRARRPEEPGGGLPAGRRHTSGQKGVISVRLADRLDNLGTETAFAVAAAAAAWKARGNEIYPFHLGDLDFPLADHIVEAMNAAIADGRTTYCPGPGI